MEGFAAGEPDRRGVGRIMALPLIGLIRLYQLLVSPLLPPSCRYYPSCSAYGLGALRRFGLVRGGYLTLHRLARCHPWSDGGVDHLPGTWAQRGSEELRRPQVGDEPADLADPQHSCSDDGASGAHDRRTQHL